MNLSYWDLGDVWETKPELGHKNNYNGRIWRTKEGEARALGLSNVIAPWS